MKKKVKYFKEEKDKRQPQLSLSLSIYVIRDNEKDNESNNKLVLKRQ